MSDCSPSLHRHTSSAVLCDPDHLGTLAAVRDLGRMGLAVDVVESSAARSLAGASRFCRTRLRGPSAEDASGLVSWLLDDRRLDDGALLYPTSDDVAWILSAHRDRLARRFTLLQPPLSTLLALMDKAQLYRQAAALGIATPDTAFPTSTSALDALADRLARDGGYPVIVKPRTQACLATKLKGQVVASADELRRAVATYRAAAREVRGLWPGAAADIQWPLVQAYRPEARARTYSLAGFADHTSTIRGVRASSKVFQIPVRIGVGVAFEARPVVAPQLALVQALVSAVGYVGVFEVEFIHVRDGDDDRYLLMDFNPRLYGQMQFEVARGLALPRLVHAAATGDAAGLAALVDAAGDTASRTDDACGRFCDEWMFRLLLTTQRLGGRLSGDDHARWRRWMESPARHDAVRDADDPAPATARRSTYARRTLAHPRATARDLFR